MAGVYPAHAMAQVDPAENPRRALHRPMMHGKGHRVALTQRHHLGARLHARPLLGQHEFAAGEIAARFRQQDRDLQREHMLAIEVLMQAIVVAFAVLQQQRRRAGLPGGVAALQESVVAFGIADVDAHRLVPAIGDAGKLRIQRRAQLRDQVRQRIGKILVLAAAKAVASHDDAAAEARVIGIERGQRARIRCGVSNSFDHRAALRVEIGADACAQSIAATRVAMAGLRGRTDDRFCRCFFISTIRKSTAFTPPDFRGLLEPGWEPIDYDFLPQHGQLDHVIAMPDPAPQDRIFEFEFEPACGADAAFRRKRAAEHGAAIGQTCCR